VLFQADNMDYYTIWQYFQQDASRIKEKMWSIASWLFTLLGTILGYMAKENQILSTSWKDPSVVMVISSIGIGVALYGRYMLRSYGFHIQSSWDRANYIRDKQLKEVKEIWFLGDKEKIDEIYHPPKEAILPKEAKILITILWGFGILFLAILALSIYFAIIQSH